MGNAYDYSILLNTPLIDDEKFKSLLEEAMERLKDVALDPTAIPIPLVCIDRDGMAHKHTVLGIENINHVIGNPLYKECFIIYKQVK